jgi:glycosyltransferase involved in cell wall biosynthesis
MRILQVSSARTLGGGETHVTELVKHLRQKGHSVVLVGRPGSPINPDIKLPFRNAADFLTALRLRKILRAEPFDVLHGHVARDYAVVTAAAWGSPNLKLVLTRHLLYPVKRHILYRRVDGWIAPTSQILTSLQPLHPRNAAVIPNWVDTHEFVYRPHTPHDPFAVGLLGQISPHKGHDDAVEALSRLGPGFKLLVAGTGDATYVDALKKKSARLPIEVLGFVSGPDFFQRIDVLIVPSWEEPFGIVLLEAMSAGVPVVATNRGGPLEIITDRTNGLLVEPRNPDLLSQAIHRLARDESLRLSLVAHGRRRVEECYDVATVIPKIEEFYARVMDDTI